MTENVKVITRDGKEITLLQWQKIYGLPEGTGRIGKFFYLTEFRFKKDLEQFGELVVNELLIRLLDAVRQASSHPLFINSFNRSEAYQEELKERGFRTATVSPHVVKLAADIDTLSEDDTTALVKRIHEVAGIVKIKVRIGYKQYLEAGQTFVHVDVCPEYYAKGKPWHDRPHPDVWEKEITW